MLEALSCCTLCPRECGANRLAGEAGACGAVGETVKVARAALHYWEEPCISGSEGSGAVFFLLPAEMRLLPESGHQPGRRR